MVRRVFRCAADENVSGQPDVVTHLLDGAERLASCLAETSGKSVLERLQPCENFLVVNEALDRNKIAVAFFLLGFGFAFIPWAHAGLALSNKIRAANRAENVAHLVEGGQRLHGKLGLSFPNRLVLPSVETISGNSNAGHGGHTRKDARQGFEIFDPDRKFRGGWHIRFLDR